MFYTMTGLNAEKRFWMTTYLTTFLCFKKNCEFLIIVSHFGLNLFLLNELKFPVERMCKSTGFSCWLLELGKPAIQALPPPHSLKPLTAFANLRKELCVLFKVFYVSSITVYCLLALYKNMYTFTLTPLWFKYKSV